MRGIIKQITALALGFASYFIPKKKNYYAFFPTSYKDNFSGNAKALALYITQNHKEIEVVILSTNKNLRKEAKAYDLKTKETTLGIAWASLRAQYVLIDATVGNFRYGNFSVIQLWHGAGFKEVGLLAYITDAQRKKITQICRKYKLVVSTSESEATKQNVSFDTTTAVSTGYPRNDIFFKDKKYINNLRKKYDIEKYKKIISYTPTFRNFETEAPFSKSFWSKLSDYLVEVNALFIVKKHPLDKYLKVPSKFQNIKDMSHKITDVQEFLLLTDVLISDYSSIITDFVLTDKPILIYPYDFELYKQKCRAMYYDIEDIFPKPFVEDEKDLIEKLKNDEWLEDEEYLESYENFKNIFHQNLDGNSSQRVIQEILKI